VDLVDQYKDYFPFDEHYKDFKPLIAAVKAFVADKANGIDKVAVTGHSLGGAMAQLFMNENLDVPVSGYTFGSPGAEHARKNAPILNLAHEDDAIPDLGDITGERSGGVVTVDWNKLSGVTAAHSIERYINTTAFLSDQASDKESPFHSHGLAKALRTGGNFVHDIRLEIATSESDTLKPFAEDRFSLAGDGDDRFKIRKDELVQKAGRDFDGGEGDDRVTLPYNKTRKGDGVIFDVIERNDGGMMLKYDSGKGSNDKWKTVGVFYRTETIAYDSGKSEPFTETATKVATADKGDLIFG
jgi:pimeloyl-ACP methyl ester carboxylesterase